GQFNVVSVEATEGAENHPDSHYRVLIRATFPGPAPDPDEVLRQVREGFGNLFGSRMVNVTDARVISRSGDGKSVEIEARTAPSRLTRRLWLFHFSILFGAVSLPFMSGPLAGQLYGIENILVNSLGATVALLVSVIITAFFVPNMLRKGTIDLLLVKPI